MLCINADFCGYIIYARDACHFSDFFEIIRDAVSFDFRKSVGS